MEAMDLDENETSKFLGVEQTDGIKTKVAFELVKSEVNNTNLISAINVKVILVAAYSMNVCKFSNSELNELNQIVKRQLRPKQMLGK